MCKKIQEQIKVGLLILKGKEVIYLSLLKANGLSKTLYSGNDQVEVLKDINMEVEEGDFLALMGPSGSGKSTLLSIMGGLNPPTSGVVLIDDIDIYSLKQELRTDFRREYIGFVFQQYHLIPYLTALENVMLPLAIMPLPGKKKKEMAQDVLLKVGLGEKGRRLPNQLSGGEQNRVAIARAIVNQPAIVFADEPTGSLDSKTAWEVMQLFQQLNQTGLTIIMVTHNEENLCWVSRALYIRDGFLAGIPGIAS